MRNKKNLQMHLHNQFFYNILHLVPFNTTTLLKTL
jgi:hypothetical protein